jgi:RNA polymerase sigma factor (sigma-70 family)
VEGVTARDVAATTELVTTFAPGLKRFLTRHIGATDAEDLTQQVLLEAIEALRAGRLVDPNRLGGYILGIARNKVCEWIRAAQTNRERFVDDGLRLPMIATTPGPEDLAARKQRVRIARDVLLSMSARDREVLSRFYLLEQRREQICEEMNLSATQFRLLKSRAKARFAKSGQTHLRTADPLKRFTRPDSSLSLTAA